MVKAKHVLFYSKTFTFMNAIFIIYKQLFSQLVEVAYSSNAIIGRFGFHEQIMRKRVSN